MKSLLNYLLSIIRCISVAFAQTVQRQIAITFDDLPVAQSGNSACAEPKLSEITRKLLQQFEAPKTPLTAFVIGGNCPALTDLQRTAVLKLWLNAGAELGNHTSVVPPSELDSWGRV